MHTHVCTFQFSENVIGSVPEGFETVFTSKIFKSTEIISTFYTHSQR